MGKEYCIAWTCQIHYEHRERLFFSTKAPRTFTGVYDVARRSNVRSISWFLVWSAVVVGEEPQVEKRGGGPMGPPQGLG